MEISLVDVRAQVLEIQSDGKTVVKIGTEEKILGILAVSDTIRHSTVSALKGLDKVGIDQTVCSLVLMKELQKELLLNQE